MPAEDGIDSWGEQRQGGVLTQVQVILRLFDPANSDSKYEGTLVGHAHTAAELEEEEIYDSDPRKLSLDITKLMKFEHRHLGNEKKKWLRGKEKTAAENRLKLPTEQQKIVRALVKQDEELLRQRKPPGA